MLFTMTILQNECTGNLFVQVFKFADKLLTENLAIYFFNAKFSLKTENLHLRK